MGFLQAVRKIVIVVATALSLLLWRPLLADEATENNLRALLTKRFPATAIDSIHPSSDLPGYYEVVTSTEIVYVDATGAHLFVGHVMDTATRENLTENRWNNLNRIDFNALPFDRAIKIVKGNGSRKLAVFEDPFCPFCKEFEKTLQSLTDVTLYIFIFPLESIHPGATDAAKDIWCAANREKAWNDWMSHDIQPEKSNCKNTPIDALVELGDKLKIFATPTIIFSDGLRAPGLMSAEKLAEHLEKSR